MSETILVYDSIEACIFDNFGESTEITGKSYVGGGDINEACCLELSSGEKVFMKANSIENEDFFRAETEGIMAIAVTGAVGTPKLIGRGTDVSRGISFLMMEYIGGAHKERDFYEHFGRSLAEMHLKDTDIFTESTGFGFKTDNYIGATKQKNTIKKSWIEFFRDCRLEPQFRMADHYFDDSVRKNIIRLLERLPELIPEPEKSSLIHGDLWSGNYIVGNDGKAWLIDPAVYVGCSEAELAMTELFGSFPRQFYIAYNEINPIDVGYKERRDLYNLYHITNHLNLFGPSYYSSVTGTIRRYL